MKGFVLCACLCLLVLIQPKLLHATETSDSTVSLGVDTGALAVIGLGEAPYGQLAGKLKVPYVLVQSDSGFAWLDVREVPSTFLHVGVHRLALDLFGESLAPLGLNIEPQVQAVTKAALGLDQVAGGLRFSYRGNPFGALDLELSPAANLDVGLLTASFMWRPWEATEVRGFTSIELPFAEGVDHTSGFARLDIAPYCFSFSDGLTRLCPLALGVRFDWDKLRHLAPNLLDGLAQPAQFRLGEKKFSFVSVTVAVRVEFYEFKLPF